MKLISLSLRNFMPYKGEQRVVFPEEPARNVMIVLADNMRGKTSLLNGIRWALYGSALGRGRQPIPLHLILNSEATREGDWVMEVAIQFEADGHRYELRRRATKKKLVATPERPEDFDVVCLLQRDGIVLPGHEVEAEINRFAPEQVSRFFLFDGELLQEYETLLIEGSEAGTRIKAAIEDVLGVPALIHGRDEATVLRKRAQKQQTQDLAHVQGAERYAERQGQLQVKEDALEEDIKALREKLRQTKDERLGLDAEVEKSELAYRSKVARDERSRRRDEIIQEHERLRVERLDLVARSWKELLRPKLSAKRLALMKRQEGLTDEIGRKGSIHTEIRNIKSLLASSECPTCGQGVDESVRTMVGGRLGSLEGALRTIAVDQTALNALSAEILTLEGLLAQGVGAQIRDRDASLNRLDVELTRVENDIEALTEELRTYDTAEIARQRALRDELLKQEGRVELDISTTQKELDKVQQDLAIVAKQLSQVPQARAARSSALAELYAGLERAFGQSIEGLRDELRRHVAARSTEAFRAMTTQQAYSELQINSNYGLTIIDETGSPVPVRSAGAEQIVALSLIDGLSRTGRAAGPVVMDTPFGRLDLKHRDNILRYLPTATSQLVLLVHDGEIRRETDLKPIAERIGLEYVIREVSPRHSVIERRLT